MFGAQAVVRLEVAGRLAAAATQDGRVHVWDPGQVCFGRACIAHFPCNKHTFFGSESVTHFYRGAGGVPACLLPA